MADVEDRLVVQSQVGRINQHVFQFQIQARNLVLPGTNLEHDLQSGQDQDGDDRAAPRVSRTLIRHLGCAMFK